MSKNVRDTHLATDVDYIAVDIDQRTKGENVDIIIKGKGQFCVKKEATKPNFVCQLMQRKKIKEHTNFVQLPTSRIICTYYVWMSPHIAKKDFRIILSTTTDVILSVLIQNVCFFVYRPGQDELGILVSSRLWVLQSKCQHLVWTIQINKALLVLIAVDAAQSCAAG